MEGNLRFSSGREIYHFCFVLLCIRWQIPSTSPTGGLYSEGRFEGGFFCVATLGGICSECYGITVIFQIRKC